MGSLPGKLIQTWLCSFGALALAGGPAVSVAHAQCVDHRTRKDADAKKLTLKNPEDPRCLPPPVTRGSSPSKPGSSKPGETNSTRTCFIAPCAAKPADTDSTNLGLCIGTAPDDLPSATLRQTDDAPRPLAYSSSLHRPAYQAHAPPDEADEDR